MYAVRDWLSLDDRDSYHDGQADETNVAAETEINISEAVLESSERTYTG